MCRIYTVDICKIQHYMVQAVLMRNEEKREFVKSDKRRSIPSRTHSGQIFNDPKNCMRLPHLLCAIGHGLKLSLFLMYPSVHNFSNLGRLVFICTDLQLQVTSLKSKSHMLIMSCVTLEASGEQAFACTNRRRAQAITHSADAPS